MKHIWLILFALPLFAQNALILKRELVVNSSVSKPEQQDVLKLKSGGNYKGEYVKIESTDVLFKPEGAYGSQQIKINEIKMLKLSDGTEVIKNGRVKRKENETITIKPGDKIMVEYDKISKSVTGLFHGFDNGEITIQTAHVQGQKPVYTNVPVNSVANIIVLPMKSAVYIPSLTASCGIIMFVLSSLDGFDSEVGFVMAGLGAITGALGGFVLYIIENDRAYKDARYTLLGKDAWYIYNQDIK